MDRVPLSSEGKRYSTIYQTQAQALFRTHQTRRISVLPEFTRRSGVAQSTGVFWVAGGIAAMRDQAGALSEGPKGQVRARPRIAAIPPGSPPAADPPNQPGDCATPLRRAAG